MPVASSIERSLQSNFVELLNRCFLGERRAFRPFANQAQLVKRDFAYGLRRKLTFYDPDFSESVEACDVIVRFFREQLGKRALHCLPQKWTEPRHRRVPDTRESGEYGCTVTTMRVSLRVVCLFVVRLRCSRSLVMTLMNNAGPNFMTRH